eukprot:TRINITY_DN101956_c0_g1_i1.p1 TRINITY_DN101956_c0_g1~~TRINITY_DN101956_c0_g1_i1.p1  ORF type:complete len:297 (-),score=59.82 TRINITY_DN101956_c0_g1_i1:304-1194(-)
MSNRKDGNDADICWICCEASEELLSTGCACRGSAGLAHVSCLVEAARHDVDRWTLCPTCKQDFTGEMEVALARARWELVQDRPPEDAERLFVANNLAVTLQESVGDYEGALKLLEEVLSVRRNMLGDEHPDTLDSITNLALQHTEMGNYPVALKLSEEVVATMRAAEAEEDLDETFAHAIGCLAAVHNLMGNHELAKPLHEEALEMRQQLLGEGHLDTLNSMHGLGQCFVGLGEHEEGLALLERVATSSKRILGEAHPSTQHFEEGFLDAKEKLENPSNSSEAFRKRRGNKDRSYS